MSESQHESTDADSWVQRLNAAALPVTDDAESLSNLVKCFKAAIADKCGVQSYLTSALADESAQDEFAEKLKLMLPFSLACSYEWGRPLALGRQFVMHLRHFAFDERASLQASPELQQSNLLIDRYVSEGFLTELDPIVVRDRSPDPPSRDVGNFEIGYLKGQARLLTLLSFCHYLYSHDEKLPDIIQATAATIHCRSDPVEGPQNELFAGMKIGYRGGLRKAPSVIQWAKSLMRLQKVAGIIPVDAVASWNSQATTGDRTISKNNTTTKCPKLKPSSKHIRTTELKPAD